MSIARSSLTRIAGFWRGTTPMQRLPLLSVITMLVLFASSYVRPGDPMHNALLACVLVLLIAQAALFVILSVLGNVRHK
jgi:hypothetical protein